MTIRRWIVVVPVLLSMVVLLLWLVSNRQDEYTVAGSYLLVEGQVGGAGIEPTVAADVLDDLLLRPSVREALASEGLSTTYEATVSERAASLRLRVTGVDSSVVVETAIQLVSMAPDLLEEAFGTSASTVQTQAVGIPTVEDVTQDGETYAIETSIVVSPTLAGQGNPFQASLSTVATLLRATSSAEFATRVLESAPDVTYAVTNTIRDAPIIDVVANGSTAEGAFLGFDAVHSQVEAELVGLQSQVRPEYRIVLRPIVEPQIAQVTPASLVRPVAGVVLVGSALAVALAALVESIVLASRQGGLRLRTRSKWLRRRTGGATQQFDPKDEGVSADSIAQDAPGGSTAEVEADPSVVREVGDSADTGPGDAAVAKRRAAMDEVSPATDRSSPVERGAGAVASASNPNGPPIATSISDRRPRSGRPTRRTAR